MVGDPFAGWENSQRQEVTQRELRELSQTRSDGLFRNPQDF